MNGASCLWPNARVHRRQSASALAVRVQRRVRPNATRIRRYICSDRFGLYSNISVSTQLRPPRRSVPSRVICRVNRS